MSWTSTEYIPELRSLKEEAGHKETLTGVFNDLATTLQYVTPVAVSVRYTKHPLASEPGLKRHTNPVGGEVLTETPITLKVPKTKYIIQYVPHIITVLKGLHQYILILTCAVTHSLTY